MRILYIGGNAHEFDSMRANLASCGEQIVLDAADGATEAIERLARSEHEPAKYDVLLLDGRFAPAAVLEALAVLRNERGLDLPVVLIAAGGGSGIAGWAGAFGGVQCVADGPEQLYALPAVLRSAADRARLEREQRALRESERRYRELVSAVPGAVYSFRIDAQGRRSMPFVSDGIGNLAGVSAAEIMTDVAIGFQRIPADAMPAFEASIMASMRDLSTWVHEFPIRAMDGEERWLRGLSTPRREPDGATVWHGVFIDITARKRAEEALRASEEKFSKAFDRVPDSITLSDLTTGAFIEVNEAFERITGFSRNEVIGRTAIELGLWGEVRGRADLYNQIDAGEARPMRRKDGEERLVSIWFEMIELGGEKCLLTVGRDVTEQKNTENALRMLSTELVLLSDEAFFNEVARRAAGFLGADIGFVSRLQAPGRTVRTLGLWSDGRLMPQIEYDLAGTPCEMVIGSESMILPDGMRNRFPAFRLGADLGIDAYAAVPLFDSHGKPMGALGVMSRTPLHIPPARIEALLRLFAVRTAAEIERVAAERRFRDLFELSPDGSLIVNQAGIVTAANRTAQVLFRCATEALVGQTVETLIPMTMREGHVGLRRSFFASATCRPMWSARADLRALRKDGTTFPVDIDLHPLHTDDGMVVVTTVRDTTVAREAERERQELEAQLRQAQKMEAVGTLAGGIAHDFNNIIGAILGNVELARQDVGAGHAALQSIEEIGKAGRRARDLVQQILAFSRKQPTSRKVIALVPVVEEALKLLQATLPAGVRLESSFAAGLPNVSADRTQIYQVLVNLCTNAWHAMEGMPGRIDIGLEEARFDAAQGEVRPGRYVRLTVRDSGKGMDAATKERIFEPFFTTKAIDEGTGLGLSVVHGIMQAHEGAIEVESAPRMGTTFRLYFPAVDVLAAELPAGATLPETPGGWQRHVLYLDDDEALVLLVSRMLERQGYRVSGYTLAHEALDAVRADAGGFDLVVSDYNMPGMSGLDVARELARIRPDLPVAVTSGYITEELRTKAPAAGVRHLIYKPNTVDELCGAVRRLTEPRDGTVR